MSSNSRSGLYSGQSRWKRVAVASPFLFLCILCMCAMDLDSIQQFLEPRAQSGVIEWENDSLPILKTFYHIKFIDDLWRGTTVAFAPSSLGYDETSWWQMFSFLVDVNVLYSIWLFESARTNSRTAISFPMIWGFSAQVLGIGLVAPIYCFVHYVFMPTPLNRSSGPFLTDRTLSLTIVPVVFLFSSIPIYLAYLAPTPATRHYWVWAWQMFPLWISINQVLLQQTVMRIADREAGNDGGKPARDLLIKRLTLGFFAAQGAVVWIYLLFRSPFTLSTIFLPQIAFEVDFVPAMRRCLQYDEIFGFGSYFLWLGYLFLDLKRVKLLSQSWLVIVGSAVLGTACFGPGAMLALGWLWREENLVNVDRRAALIEKRRKNK